MPLVSVIIPAFNSSKTIQATINSVLQQTINDLELIIINDGSTDSTLSIISTITDQRLKVFSYTNSGLATSRNRGIAKALGQYISFIDADDLWTIDKLELQLQALKQSPQAAVAYSWTDWIDESGKFLRPGGHITFSGSVYDELLLRDFIESGSNPLIRKMAFDKTGGFDESLSAVEDWDMWLRLAAHFEFVAVPLPQILYRVSPNSMSSNVCNMEIASLQVIEKAFAQAPHAPRFTKQEVLANRYKYLTLKTLEGSLNQRRGFIAIRFWCQAIRNDPAWLRRKQLMLIILGKIGLAVLIPEKQSQILRQWIRSISSKD